MKKILMLAVVAAMAAATSCKKTDEAGVIAPPAPKKATLSKVASDSIFTTGTNTVLKTQMFIQDTTTITRVIVYSSNIGVAIQNVQVTFTGTNSSQKVSRCQDMGTVPEGRYFLDAPFNKVFIPDTYECNVLVDVPNTNDSTVITVVLECATGKTNYSVTLKSSKLFFIVGNTTTKVSSTTAISSSIQNTTNVSMLTLATSVVGLNQVMKSIDVRVNHPLVTTAKAFINGSSIGSIATSGVGTYTIPTNVVLQKGTSTDIVIRYDFGAFTAVAQTGQVATAVVEKITYADASQTNTTTYTGNPMYVYKSLFEFKTNSAVNQQVSTGGNTLYELEVKTTVGSVKQLSFNVLWGKAPTATDTLGAVLKFFENGNDITNQVYITNQNGDTLAGNKITQSTTRITVLWIGGESAVSTSTLYRVQGVCTGFKTAGSYVQLDFAQDPSTVVGKIAYNSNFTIGIAGTVATNVLSDKSHPAHTFAIGGASTSDWFTDARMTRNTRATTTSF